MTSPLPISKQKDLGTRLVRTLGSLSKDVFEQRTSTGSEAISLLIYLNATKCALLSVFTLIKTIPLKIKKKTQLFKNAKSLLPVHVRCSCSREKRNIRVRDKTEPVPHDGYDIEYAMISVSSTANFSSLFIKVISLFSQFNGLFVYFKHILDPAFT